MPQLGVWAGGEESFRKGLESELASRRESLREKIRNAQDAAEKDRLAQELVELEASFERQRKTASRNLY